MSDNTTPETTKTYNSPLLARPGAAELQSDEPAGTPGVDATGVAWHYGEPLNEQRAAASATAVIDRSHRTVISVAGSEAAGFLNNLLTQKLDDAADGYAASALDLNIQGRILHHTDLVLVKDTFYLDFPTPQAATFVDFLRKMIFWSDVEIEETDLAILTLLGDAVAVPEDLETAFVRRVDWNAVPRRDIAVERSRLDEAVDQLLGAGAQLSGLMAFTAERVRALEPELGVDIDEKAIPHEIPQFIGRNDHLGAVHLEKGCYRGQETVARVENIGRSPRLLVLLQLDGSTPQPAVPGDQISFNGRKVGRVGTVVHDCDYGPVALALVKRSALDAGELIINNEAGDRTPVAAAIDPSSLPIDEGEKAGRAAISQLRSGPKDPE